MNKLRRILGMVVLLGVIFNFTLQLKAADNVNERREAIFDRIYDEIQLMGSDWGEPDPDNGNAPGFCRDGQIVEQKRISRWDFKREFDRRYGKSLWNHIEDAILYGFELSNGDIKILATVVASYSAYKIIDGLIKYTSKSEWDYVMSRLFSDSSLDVLLTVRCDRYRGYRTTMDVVR